MDIKTVKYAFNRFFSMTGKANVLSGQKKSWLKKKKCGNSESRLFAVDLREKTVILSTGAGMSLLLSATFFQSICGILLTFPVMFLYMRYAEKKLVKKKKHQLEIQFKDAILSVASSLQAGYSLTHAFEDALAMSGDVYGKKSMIVALFEKVVWGQRLNIPMDQLLEELAENSQLEEVRNFTEVIKVTRRYGGNLPDMIQKLAGVIEDRLAVKAEILSVTTSVRYEAYVMDLIPVAIIWYMNLTGPSFLEVLYNGLAGRVFMSVCMFVYLGIIVWQFHIMENMID